MTWRRTGKNIGLVEASRLLSSRPGRAVVYFLVSTALGLLSASVILTSEWSEGQGMPPGRALLMELSGAWTFLLLLPVAIAFVRRFPIERGSWPARLPLHLAFSVVLGVTHTLLMWGSRIVAFRILGWGAYDYGLMRYRFLMEYQKQLLSYGLVYAAVTFVGYVRRSREGQLRAAALRSQLSEARLDALKSQLNPHFLFNTLNAISSYVHTDPDRADAMISHLSTFLRGTLTHSDRQEIRLEQELELLHPYLEIMRARFEAGLRVAVEVEPDCGRTLVPHMLLQPIVENAMTHGAESRTGPRRVRLAAGRHGQELEIVVEDDGPGLAGVPSGALARGVGLGNTERRLAELYGEAQRLELSDAPGGGLRVRLRLPWREPEATAA